MTPTQLHRLNRQTLTILIHTHHQLHQTLTTLHNLKPGYPTNTAANPTPTQHATTSGLDKHLKPDPINQTLHQIQTTITQLNDQAKHLQALLQPWTDHPTPSCTNCHTPHHTLKRQLCPTCYKQHQRSRDKNPPPPNPKPAGQTQKP